MARRHAATLLTAFLLTGCAAIKNHARTVNDIASDLCMLVATENAEQLAGLTPRQWCQIHENLQPFIDEVLAAKRSSETKVGLQEKESE